MSDASPMVKKIRQLPATTVGERKFTIPKKGRIRAVLALVLIVVALVFICDRGDENQTPIDGAAPADTSSRRDSSITDTSKSSSIKNPSRDTIKKTVADSQKTVVTDQPNDTAKTPAPKRRFFFSCNNEQSVRPDTVPVAAANTSSSKKNVPDFMMGFDDVKRIVKEHNITPLASEQTIVVNNAAYNGKSKERGRGAGKNKNASVLDTLTVSLSIDTMLQKYAQSMFRRYAPRYAAAVAIEPSTGRVLALASFANEEETLHDGGDLYLRGIFPAASVFKTIVAAAGIEKGRMNAQTPIQHFGRRHTLYRTQIQKELKVSEDITLQDAFAYSVNPAFARIALYNVNKDVVFNMGKNFGFNETIPFEYSIEKSMMYYPDSAFSVAEFASGFNRQTTITPVHGAMLAAAICDGGALYRPTMIDSIRSSNYDTLVYRRRHDLWRRPVSAHTAAELRTLLTSVTRYGTARKTYRTLRDSPRYGKFEFGGKTGNVNKQGLGKVDWFVGYARNPADKKQQIAISVVTTHGEYWTVQSSYVASELMKKYIQRVTSNENLTK